MTYYAVQVRTGSEYIVAQRLTKLNELNNNKLFNNVVVPIQVTNELDLINSCKSTSETLIFSGYVFVKLEKLTPALFQKIRSVSSSVYTVLDEAIPEDEILSLIDREEKVALIVSSESDERIDHLVESSKSVVNHHDKIHQVTIRKNRQLKKTSVIFSLKKFNQTVTRMKLTISDMLDNPLILIESMFSVEMTY